MEASLVNRLAGPSTGKAGLAKDQTEINRIIAESSKGSQFFENEKRKDKELTEKIERLLKHRDDMLRGIDVGRLEASIDKTLIELEAKRDLTQYVVHVDMDAFFASVELLDNPKLKDRPFGVGKGVLTTASYEARLYGVRSGMAGFIAKKLCPQIILVRIRPDRYSEMSNQESNERVQKVPTLNNVNDVHSGSITHYCQTNALSPDDCVEKLRAEVRAETSLTVSAGIAPNKMLAKICSDRNKPNGQFHLSFDREAIVAFMRELPIRKIPGIGRVTERLLDSIGIKTCGDIHKQRATLSLLDKQFHLHSLLLTHLGIASNVVQPGQRDERKSVGSERTFSPISDVKAIIEKLENCAAELEEDMERTGWAGRTITLKYKLDTYQVFTRAQSSTRYINRKEELFDIGKRLLMPELPLTIRLIGLRVTKLKDLRMPEGKGLKKFFESGYASPSKKRQRREPILDEDPKASEHVLEEEQAMAEYEDDTDEEIIVDEDDGGAVEPSGLVAPLPKARLSKQNLQQDSLITPDSVYHSAGHVQASTNILPAPISNSEVESKITKLRAVPVAVQEQVCPICEKVFDIDDNTGLNEHVDFCLSKKAILAATAVPHGRSPVKKKRRSS